MDPIKQITSFNLGSSGLISVLGEESTQHTEVASLQQYLYVETKLDTALLPQIRNGDWDLVVISGNAGDGKSAFLLRIADGERARDGRPIRVNRDATHSDSPDETQADRLMRDFIHFSDRNVQHRPEEIKVIAMNTGMLVSFFDEAKHRVEQTADDTLNTIECVLKMQLGIMQHGRCPQAAWKVLLVDLNHRSVVDCQSLTAEGFSQDDVSVFSRLVEKIADSEAPMWDRCHRDCPTDPNMCYVRQNVVLLQEPKVQQRLHLLLGLVHVRGQQHLSIRALLSLLSYLIAGHYGFYQGYDDYCKRVADLVAAGATGELLGRLFYNVVFSDEPVFDIGVVTSDPTLAQDAFGEGTDLVEALNKLDFAAVVGQRIDGQASRFFYDQEHMLEHGASDLENRAFGVLIKSLKRYGERIAEAAAEGHTQQERELRHEARALKLSVYRLLKRRSFFFDIYDHRDLTATLPHLREFLGTIDQVNRLSHANLSKKERALATREVERMGGLVTRAILKSDRVKETTDDVRDGRAIQLRLYGGLEQMSFNAIATQPISLDPRLDGGPSPDAMPFVEHNPTTVSLQFRRSDGSALGDLEIDASLYEFLHRIDEGYLPCSADIQRFVHLQTFKDQLRRQLGDEIDSMVLADPRGAEIVRVQRSVIDNAPFYNLDVIGDNN